MKELIQVKAHKQLKESVSARDLYFGLGLAKDQWSRWQLKNIVQNDFFMQDFDFVKLDIVSTPALPNPPVDFAISIEFAKHIALMARTEKSHEYRSFLIRCESKAPSLPDFNNPAEAARAWANEFDQKRIANDERDKALLQIEVDKPKVKFADVVSESSNTRCVRVWVKVMKNENNLRVGEQEVFKWLMESKYIFKDGKSYLPYAKYEANGVNYFTVTVDEINGRPRRQLKITGKGVIALTGKAIRYFSDDSLAQGEAA